MQQKYIDLLDRLDEFFKEIDVPLEEDECCEACELKLNSLNKSVNKAAKNIEQLEIEMGTLRSNSHPPIFSEDDYKDLVKRIKKLENGKK